MNPAEISAVLVMGGKSQRMGRDKATLPYGDTLLWRHQVATLKAAGFAQIALSVAAPGKPDLGEVTEFPVLPDAHPGAGPVNGILSALRWSASLHVLVLAVDVPKMSAAYLQALSEKCTDGMGIISWDGENFEPLVAIYPASALAEVEAQIQAGEYKLQRLARRACKERWLGKVMVDQEVLPLFENWNEPGDMDELGG